MENGGRRLTRKNFDVDLLDSELPTLRSYGQPGPIVKLTSAAHPLLHRERTHR